LSQNFDQSKGKSNGNPRKVEAGGGRASCSAGSDKSEVIGDALKSFYQKTLNEEVPDDFQNLLNKLN